ncbi:hypothetical protein [Ideonella sp.]|uniref:hypothetical protein n=1 Tax=Ideonella sp. TaxID=1929293 RepID=UPI0035AEB45A
MMPARSLPPCRAPHAGARWTARLALAGLAWAGIAAAPAQEPARAPAPERVARCGDDTACLAGLERDALRQAGAAAQRQGAELRLQFGAHAPARFVDQPPVTHLYLGRLDGLALHLVRAAQPGRLPAWWLVGEGAQPPLRVDALPVAGPLGRHFIVASGAMLALYERAGDRWSMPYRFEAPAGLTWEVRGWRADEAAVRLGWTWPDGPSACAGQGAQGALQLRDGPYGWDLVPEAPRRCAPQAVPPGASEPQRRRDRA